MKKDNIILIALLIGIFLLASCCGYFAFEESSQEEIITDAIKIQREYASLNDKVNETNQKKYLSVNLSEDNPFCYAKEEEIINLLENGTGIIYFGFKTCPWCRSMIEELEKTAKEKNLDKIYYLDISNIRDTLALDENDKIVTEKQGSSTYYKIVKFLEEYLKEYTLTSKEGKIIKTGEKRLFAPTVLAVSNGEIRFFHEGTIDSQKNGYEKLTEEQKGSLRKIFSDLIDSLSTNTCKESC